MKLLVTATISGPSSTDVQNTKMSILKALESVKDRTSNDIKIGSCNAQNSLAFHLLMGQLLSFSLGREPDGFSEHKRQASKKRRAGIVEESIDDILMDL